MNIIGQPCKRRGTCVVCLSGHSATFRSPIFEQCWKPWKLAHRLYEADIHCAGGCFRARMKFPPTYPHLPPTLKFETPIFHPNVYENGEVCISILHPPEDDKYGYESASERWSPVQTPETILLSVISMLSSPNDESPANIEAGKLWRNDKKEFRKRVRRCVRDSQENFVD
jgi:ubiquitin-conjugating enzyme E2 G1